jgi:ADP-ribose pyrophosphatase
MRFRMPTVEAIEIVEDRTAASRCDEGFLRLKRYRARNRRSDGSRSAEYPIDVIDRPALDAVAVCAWARGPRGVEVLTRRGLRPAAFFRRGKEPVLPEPDYLLVEELVAGVVEPGERGLEALQRRGADELREEAGLEVAPGALEPLGGAFFMLPGIASEKIHLLAVEVARGEGPEAWPAPEEGDGSPLEEGAELRWRPLAEAVEACERGEIEDAKTELALRRLAARLGERLRAPRLGAAPPGGGAGVSA